jgi:hypothetical protein
MSPEPESICILDDDASVRHSIKQLLDSDGLKEQSFEDSEVFRVRPQPCGAPGRARCVDARDERPGSASAAARGVARHESDRDDRQGNTRDSRPLRWKAARSPFS